MNPLSAAALAALAACSLPRATAQQSAAPRFQAQDSRSGISTPPPAIMDSTPAPDSAVTPGYQPTPPPNLQRRQPADGTTSFAPAEVPQPLSPTEDTHTEVTRNPTDVDAGIVTSIPHAADELPTGTTFKARMRQTLSTATTPAGTPFSAELTEPVQQDGRIVIPSGARVEGSVSEVRGGRRVHGAAALHLDPRTLVLPDGSRHLIRAQVIDTSESFATRIDSEGTIIRRDHIKQTLAGMGLATGGAIVAGAVLGGGVGALVGAGVGVGVSTAWWLKQDRQTVLPEETAVVFSLNEPLALSLR